jgi:hypothetical protein
VKLLEALNPAITTILTATRSEADPSWKIKTIPARF